MREQEKRKERDEKKLKSQQLFRRASGFPQHAAPCNSRVTVPETSTTMSLARRAA